MEDVTLRAVDMLAAVRAQIAELRKAEQKHEVIVRKALEKADPANQVVDGELFRARLVTQIRNTLDAEKVRMLLHPNQLRVCEQTIVAVSVRLTARPTAKLLSGVAQ